MVAQFSVHLFHVFLTFFNGFPDSRIIADLAAEQLSQYL